MDFTTATAAAVGDSAPDSGELIDARYAIEKCIGSGGMGSVYLVSDTRVDDRELALKQVRGDRADQTTFDLLRREFLTLTELRHPNLTRAYDFGVDRATQDLYYTCEFVDGVNWISAMDELDLRLGAAFRTFLALVVQTLRALEFIHSRGLVHCDIKPENILICGIADWKRAVPRVKLIDFGLVKPERVRSGKKVLGTPYYVAPETILGSPVDRRADLYSLGVVLYHLVTGEPPFLGPSNLDILKNHVETVPAPPHTRVPFLSPRFSEIVLRLMEKNPAKRFQGALEIVEAINAAFSMTFSLETEETLKSYLDVSWLAGRDRESQALEQALRVCVRSSGNEEKSGGALDSLDSDLLHAVGGGGELAVPKGRMIILRGEKGLGKLRLAEKIRYTAQVQGVRCLEVRCDKYFGPGVQEFRQFLDELRTLGPDGRVAENSYLDRAAAFLRLVSTHENRLKARNAQNELQSVVLGFLKATRESPAVLYLQNFQSAGALMARVAELLAQAQAEEWVSESHLLVIATLLDQGAVENRDFQRLRSNPTFRSQTLELALSRLDLPQVNGLIRSAFAGSRLPNSFVRRVHEESDGNTGVVLEILEYLLRHGHVRRLATGWALDKDHELIEVPGRVRRALEESLARLPRPTLHLAIALSSMEHDFVPEVAATLAGVAARGLSRCLGQLLREGIIQERMDDRDGVDYSFVHQSAKKLLYTRIAAKKRAAIHDRLGSLLEEHYGRTGGVNTRELAHHFLRARNREKGVQYGLEAARDYARESLPLQAIATYRSVLELSGEEDLELQSRVHWEIAALRLKVGDYRGVIELLEPLCAEAAAEGIRKETSLFLQIARAQICLGSFDRAETLLRGRLELEETASGAKGLVAAVLMECAVLNHVRGRTVESLRYCHRVESVSEAATDVALQIQLHMLMAENHARLHDNDSAAGHCQRALRLIEAQHDPDLLDLSFYCRGKFYRYEHKYRSSLKQFRLAAMLRARKRIFDGQADCLLELGALNERLGLPQKARPHLAKALAIYKRTGNLRGTATALALLGEVDRLIGRHDNVGKELNDALRQSASLSDRELAQRVSTSFAAVYADRGELRRSEKHLDRVADPSCRRTSSSPAEMNAIAMRGEVALWRGDYRAALKHCHDGLQIARELRDPGRTADFLVQRSLLATRLGRSGEARRSIASLMDLTQRHELWRQEGWGRLIEGIVLSQQERMEPAEKAFAQATDLFIDHGSERDLVSLYLEYGLFSLKRHDHEQSYLNLEEGFYLARNLDLSYLKCRFFFARGLLEASLSEKELVRAEESFRFAANLSARAPFQDVRWQVHYHYGELLLRMKKDADASKHFTVAANCLQDVLTNIPAETRTSYAAMVPAKELRGRIGGMTKSE